MGPAFYVMAILGCGEAEAACQQVALAETRYESVEACNAATADAVVRNMGLPYPVVVAQCQRSDNPIAQKIVPSDIDLPEPGNQPRFQRADYKPAKRVRL